MIIFKENGIYVSYSPELDISSCGDTIEQARQNLKIAVRLFLEEAEKMGTLEDILIGAGYQEDETNKWKAPDRREIPVFIIKNNLRTAQITRDEYFELLNKI